MMKRLGIFGTAFLLFTFLGATAFAQTQTDQQGERQGKKQEKAQPEKQQQSQQPAQQQPQRPQRAQQQPQQPVQQQPHRPQHAQQQPQQPAQQQPQRPQHAQQQPQQPAQQQPQRPQHAQQQPQLPVQQQPQRPQHAQQQPQLPVQQQPQRPQHAQQQPQLPVQQQPQRPQHAQQQPQLPVQQQPQWPQRAQQQPQQPVQQQPREERTTQFAQLKSAPEQQRVWQQEQHRTWQQHRARSFDSEHRSWQQRGGYTGYRIPDNDFHRYYGSDHWFRVFSLPFLVVGGSPRFQYGGYWFSPVEAYPEYWGDNWYQNDDVYVDYVGDGYYLFNRRFPGHPGIALSIFTQEDHYPTYYRDQIPGGSYALTCQNIRVRGNMLYASCQMMNAEWRDTALRNFDQCVGEITNVNGDLQCIGSFQQYQYPNQRYYPNEIPGGSYTLTCQNIRVNGNMLYATCQTMNADWRDTALSNFDQCGGEITNVNGELQCR